MKVSKVDMVVVVIIAVTMIGVFALAFFAEPAPVQEHGSYLKCDYRTVKGACGKWSTVKY